MRLDGRFAGDDIEDVTDASIIVHALHFETDVFEAGRGVTENDVFFAEGFNQIRGKHTQEIDLLRIMEIDVNTGL